MTTFVSLHLHGPRFDAGPGMPVEVLAELVAYRDLVAEVARHLFLQGNPARQRVPKGFTDSFSLRLRRIEEGSAAPVLERVRPVGTLVATPDAFDSARDLISEAVAAAANGGPTPRAFPREAIVHFNRFGQGLSDEESIELRAPDAAVGARYNQRIRRVLLAERSYYQRDAERTGWVTEIDADKMRFHLRLSEGSSVPVPMDDVMFDDVKAALRPSGVGPQVLIGGVGVFDKSDRLVRFDSLHQVMPAGAETDGEAAEAVDAAEVEAGWLDGEGAATHSGVLERARSLLARLLEDGAPVPRVYPVPDGGLQAEWTIGSREVSVTVEPGGTLYVISVDTSSGESNDETVADDDVERVVHLLALDGS